MTASKLHTCSPIFRKTSHNHILGHILSYLPFEQATQLVLVSKTFYNVIYSPHTLFILKELNKYPHLIPKSSFSRSESIIKANNRKKIRKTNKITNEIIKQFDKFDNLDNSEKRKKRKREENKEKNHMRDIVETEINERIINEESFEIKSSQNSFSGGDTNENHPVPITKRNKSQPLYKKNQELITKGGKKKRKLELSDKTIFDRKRKWINSLSNAALVKFYFSSLEIFRVDEKLPTIERRVFRCFLRRSNHFLKELSLFRSRLKAKTLCRILKECTVLETLELRFIDWIPSENNKKIKKKKIRMDLSTSIEYEKLLQNLEDSIHSQPLKLDFHENGKLSLKTLEIRNENTSQMEPLLIEVIAQCCGSITSLTLAHFSEEQLRDILELVPNSNSIERIHLAWMTDIRIETIESISSCCLSLKHLKFSHSTYQGYVPSLSNDFSKFYSLLSLNTLLCDSKGLTEAVLAMLPKSEMNMSHFQSIAYQGISEKRIPFEDIQLRHLCCFHFDRAAELFLIKNHSYLTHVNITETKISENQVRSILNCKYIKDLRIKVDDTLSLIHLIGIISKYSARSNIENLIVYLGYPPKDKIDFLFDIESQMLEKLEIMEIHGQFHPLPLCFCPQLKKLSIHDLYFNDLHNFYLIVGQYNSKLEFIELFNSILTLNNKNNKGKYIWNDKLPLIPSFSVREIRIMASTQSLHLYDIIRLIMHFPLTTINTINVSIKFSNQLCGPFVKHPKLTNPLDAFKALFLWCLDQIFTQEHQATSDSKEYISSLIRIIDTFEIQNVNELPQLSHLFTLFKSSFSFAPELPIFSPPRSLTRIVVSEKYNQFMKKIKRKEENILKFLDEYTI